MGRDWIIDGPDSTVRLNNGIEMPVFGLGTYRSGIGRQTREAVKAALDNGYRLVDTATIYGNERDVGQGIRESILDRGQVFLTTKLWNSDHGYERTKKAFHQSLKMLNVDHIDLYLMHWPVGGYRLESWKAMEELNKEGLARSIGVSNFGIRHLDELLEEGDIVPSVNQVEFTPFLYQRELLEYCLKKGIQLESYSPLTKGRKLGDPTLNMIAQEHGRTPAQVLIRWALQAGAVTIPKSTRSERIIENVNVFDFELTPGEMDILNGLDEGLRTGWDPSDEP
ncbi:MAG: aldo/keto reductase [Thermoplasmatota archaeon]